MRMRTLVLGCIAALATAILPERALLFPAAAAPPEPAPARIDFNREVRPLLSDKCYACHGPDGGQRQAKLRLDTREGAFADRGGYQVIVPGDRSKSKLFQRINHEQAVARMPPPTADRQLDQQEVDLLGRWIDQGADWQTPLGLCVTEESASAESQRPRLAPQRRRPFHSGEARPGGSPGVGARRESNAAAPSHAGLDRTAADAAGT